MEMKKPTRKEILHALHTLTLFCTSGDRYQSRNPYLIEEIKQACKILAREKGKTDYLGWNGQ